MPQYINGLEALARKFARLSVEEHAVVSETMGGASHILHRKVRSVFGDRSKLAELRPYTQEERTALGFTPNDPLLRDGSLLRDAVEREHLGFVAGVGTTELVQLFSELGFVNARTGTAVPPRRVFQIGLDMSRDEILEAFTDALAFIFDGRIRTAIPPSP